MLSILFYKIRKLKPKVIQLVKEEARIQTRSRLEVPDLPLSTVRCSLYYAFVASHLSSTSEKVE